MFVYDSSNFKTFESLQCILEVINEITKANQNQAKLDEGKDA